MTSTPMTGAPSIALCLPGGGASGAMYQIGALAALEDVVDGLDVNAFGAYVGTSSGASVAAALAGGCPVRRIYRAFLDPADLYFDLERKHFLQVDFSEWRRTLLTGSGAIWQGLLSIGRRGEASRRVLWEELERLYDSMPAGFFSLEAYERFLADFFLRRGVPNHFGAIGKTLRVMAYDLDSGEQVLFGSPGYDEVPVTRACIASMAAPPFFSPVRIGTRHYIDAGAAQVAHLDAAVDLGANLLVVVNPMVPVEGRAVPTGHGRRDSLRDKGLMWVLNQSVRLGLHKLMQESCARIRAGGRAGVILIEPAPTEAMLFLHNPFSFSARRQILEQAYRTTRTRVLEWLDGRNGDVALAGWQAVRVAREEDL